MNCENFCYGTSFTHLKENTTPHLILTFLCLIKFPFSVTTKIALVDPPNNKLLNLNKYIKFNLKNFLHFDSNSPTTAQLYQAFGPHLCRPKIGVHPRLFFACLGSHDDNICFIIFSFKNIPAGRHV